jgi:5-methylcytosine-specific restriction protein A
MASGRIDGMAERNPNWTRDELILALDVYMRHRPGVLGNTSPEVIELSEMLNQLARVGRDRSPTHRNANGVAMKLLNFRPFDPEYTARGKVGLHHYRCSIHSPNDGLSAARGANPMAG